MGKLEKIPVWQLTKVRNIKEVIAEARDEGRTVHFASLMDLCHLKNSELEPQFQKYKGRVVLRGDTGERWFRLLRSISRARIISVTNDSRKSNGCHSKTARMRGTRSRRNICLHPAQNGRCSIVIENSSQNAQIVGYVHQNTNGPNHGPVWKIQSFFLSEICMNTLWQDYYGKDSSRKFYWNTVGQKFQFGNVYS